jgi:hypothetical protein
MADPNLTLAEASTASFQMTQADLQQLMCSAISNSFNAGGQLHVPKFSGFNPHELLTWIAEYELAAKVKGWKPETQLQRVAGYLTDSAKQWFILKVVDNNNPRYSWENFKQEIKEHFLPEDNRHFQMNEIESRQQQPLESVTNYITAMRMMCKRLDRAMDDSDVMHYIMRGIRPDIRETLFGLCPNSVEDLLKKAKAIELGKGSSAIYHAKSASSTNNNALEDKMNTLIEVISKLSSRDSDEGRDFSHNRRALRTQGNGQSL